MSEAAPAVKPKQPKSQRKKKRQASSLEYRLQYAALRGVTSLLTLFSPEEDLEHARTFASIVYQLNHKHRRRAMEHISRAFPDWSYRKRKETVRQAFDHFFMLGVEIMFSTSAIDYDNWAERIIPTKMDEAVDLLLKPKPAIMITAHFGNWELMGNWLALAGIKMNALARPIDNPYVNEWLLGVRERRGLKVITKYEASLQMDTLMKNNEPVSFIADQNAGDKGYFVPFFSRMASAYKSIGVLAMNYQAPLICGYAKRLGNEFKYEVGTVDIIYPEDWEDQPDPLFYITARYQRAIEKMIRIAPEQFGWFHRRWRSRPRYERQGKPMPKKMIQKLEALPWMTPDLLAELQKPVPYSR